MGVPYGEVIGDPIAHSKSPLIHKFWLKKLGLDYDFRRTRVAAGQLPVFLEARRADPHWCGCSVTLPHKISALPHMSALEPSAKAARALNCITRQGAREPRLIGANTDVTGFLEPLRPRLDAGCRNRMATVIGTGGAASAVSYALAREGFLIINVGRTVAKAAALRERLGLDDDPDFAADLGRYQEPWKVDWGDRSGVLDVVVNATPLGMTGFPPLPFNLRGAPPGTIVYDLVYDPIETAFLRQARQLGLSTLNGLQMLVAQAALAFERFFAEKPPRHYDGELGELLTR